MVAALPFLAVYIFLSLALVLYDLRSGLLPDRFTCPLLWSGLTYQQCIFPDHLSDALWGAVAGYGGFAFLYWSYRIIRKKEGLGYGDVKFLAALGAWHGWTALPLLVFCAALLATMGVAVMAITRGTAILKNPLPFGPFLAAAGFITGIHNLVSGTINWSL
ncbi:prepilin peptidase [Citrobacter tructae]|uniref:prepilin peptidase n=1 Tax=Citrobacter tructae TaxID=2562449 RepID=UPI003F55FC2F